MMENVQRIPMNELKKKKTTTNLKKWQKSWRDISLRRYKMANKDISEVNISRWGKATASYHLVIRIAKIKNSDNTKCWRDLWSN